MPSRALESVRKMIYVLLDRTGTGVVVVVLVVVDVTSRSEVVEDDEEMRIFYLIAICFAQRRKIPLKRGYRRREISLSKWWSGIINHTVVPMMELNVKFREQFAYKRKTYCRYETACCWTSLSDDSLWTLLTLSIPEAVKAEKQK